MCRGTIITTDHLSMKRKFIFLGVLLYCTFASAQIQIEMATTDAFAVAEDTIVKKSETQIAFEAAERAYERYFTQTMLPAANKKELYGLLLESFAQYGKCLDSLNTEQRQEVKEKIRRMRPQFEEAGISFSSAGDNKQAAKYLECYIQIPRMPLMQGEQFEKNANYPAYVFNVAAEKHNARDFENAVTYLQEYIELGEKQYQQTCYKFLAKDLDILERLDEEANVLEEGIMNYPNDLELLKQGIMLNMHKNKKDKTKDLLGKALTLAPDDPSLQLFKASIDDQEGRYEDALPVLKTFHERMPDDIQLTKQLAFCYYNLAGTLINQSNLATDAEQFKSLRADANDCFNETIKLLEPLSKKPDIVNNDQRIMFALSDALTQVGRSSDASAVQQLAQQSTTILTKSDGTGQEKTPNFNEWYKPRLEKILAEWEQRGEFEPANKYVKRVNPETRKALIAKTRTQLEKEFIAEYKGDYNLDELTLKPYDPDHQTYRIQTRQGDLYIRVPLENEEAVKFKESWNGVKIVAPQFKVDKSGHLRLMAAKFSTPYGMSYDYNANEPLEYQRIKVARPEWNDDDLLAELEKENSTTQGNRPSAKTSTEEEPINVGESSVDVNVPRNKEENTNTFALIIANEVYKNVENVPFALNDGKSFNRYCRDVLGVPYGNIIHIENGTGNEMTDAIDRIKDFELAYENIKLIVYYSGHGLPDPSTNESYLLPSDASPRNISTGYKLSKFYEQLTANNPQSVTVFLDACFSGAKKDGKVIDQTARGVIVKPKEETPTTNMVVFSACTGNETAYPYNNQKHGLFTYFLLKKLQEDKGKTTYKRLAEYISTNVKQKSLSLNGKLQTPTTVSALPSSEWGNWRLDK